MFFREAGVTAWNMEQRPQGVSFWQTALKYTNYDFENRLVMVNIKNKRNKTVTKPTLEN